MTPVSGTPPALNEPIIRTIDGRAICILSGKLAGTVVGATTSLAFLILTSLKRCDINDRYCHLENMSKITSALSIGGIAGRAIGTIAGMYVANYMFGQKTD
jgi:hypothetical protein